jgi:hypothetical protein
LFDEAEEFHGGPHAGGRAELEQLAVVPRAKRWVRAAGGRAGDDVFRAEGSGLFQAVAGLDENARPFGVGASNQPPR